jgi:hypothetical protein
MIRAATLAAAVVAALAVPAVAAAGGKERVLVDRFTDHYSLIAVDCSELGPYDFSIEVDGRERISVVDVYGRDGTLLQTEFHIGMRETDANTVTGKTLPLHGAVHEVWDYASGTRTIDGAVWLGTERGQGVFVQDTGRITLTLDTDEAQWVAGPHEAFFAGGVDPLVCAALDDG